jgi:hypothetical protein
MLIGYPINIINNNLPFMKYLFKKRYVITIVVLMTTSLVILINYVDFGFNSKILITKLINTSFEKRITGDEKSFQKYLSDTVKSMQLINGKDSVGWISYLENDGLDLVSISEFESDMGISIVNYEIIRLSNDFLDSNAYVQIKLTRQNRKNYEEVNKESFVTYKLIKINNIWKIDYRNNEGIVFK